MKTSIIDLPERFGGDPMPLPSLFIDCSNGLIEIWVNIASHEWLVSGAVRTIGSDLQKTKIVIEDYKIQLCELRNLWNKVEISVPTFQVVLALMRTALANLHALFYVITSDASLQEARDIAMSIRAEDHFFVEA